MISDIIRILPTPSSRAALAMAAAACLGVGASSAMAETNEASANEAMFSFHLMQIEAAIGGVNGDVTAQAVELRMRSPFQNHILGKRIFAWDATGQNPVMLVEFPSDVNATDLGTRILVATSSFVANSTPHAAPDFMMTNMIPQSYLAAGRLTFEDDFGAILWSLAWGGANYTGSTTGSLTNDSDGQFGPPFDGPLPSTTTQALHFQGSASDMSTSNHADYLVTPGPAVFFNSSAARFAAGDGSTFGFEITGHCPGTVNLTWSGATPTQIVAIIFGSTLGHLVIPNNNQCAGTQLGIGAANARLVQTVGAGSNGINSINGSANSGACDGYLQLLDLDTCRPSNVDRISP